MKKISKITAAVLAAITLLCSMTIFAAAKTGSDVYQKSIVFIRCTVNFNAANYNYSFSQSWSGTGFAVGLPGQKVQYIATCDHVAQAQPGIYMVLIDPQTMNYVDCLEMPEGTAYPASYTAPIDGKEYIVVCDFFQTETADLSATFSNSSNDYTSLTVTQFNNEIDLAICKLAGEPTDKISALPLQKKDSVEVNTRVIAVGYASTSRVFNAEARFDKTDSTLKDGIISKIQRTTGTNGSKTTYDTYEVTADLTTGMSGGPVISEETGAVVGVTAFGVSDSSQAKSSDYAICVDYVADLLDKEHIPYKTTTGKPNLTLIIGIIAAVLVIGGVVLVITKNGRNSGHGKASKASKGDETEVINNREFVNPAPSNNSVGKKFYLIAISGPLAGQKFSVTNRAVIGRDNTKCNVVFPINHPGVSGIHCEVKVDGSIMTVRDCGSSYGTFLDNGTKLNPNSPVMLQSGARFWVGARDNMFEVKY